MNKDKIRTILNPMNKNKIRTIINLFRNYQVCLHKDYFFYIDNVNVNLAEVEFEPNNEVVYLFWEGSDGEEYRIKFDEAGLSNARIKDGNLIIEDTEGDEIEITFNKLTKYAVTFL